MITVYAFNGRTFFNLAKAHACYFIKSFNGMRWKVICATLLS